MSSASLLGPYADPPLKLARVFTPIAFEKLKNGYDLVLREFIFEGRHLGPEVWVAAVLN